MHVVYADDDVYTIDHANLLTRPFDDHFVRDEDLIAATLPFFTPSMRVADFLGEHVLGDGQMSASASSASDAAAFSLGVQDELDVC